MTEMQRMKLIQEEHEARKKTVGAQIGNANAKKQSAENQHIVSENSKTPKLRAEMAKEHNLGLYDIESAVNVGRGIDRAAEVEIV